MKQVFPFYGCSPSGQQACLIATEKANRFIRRYQLDDPKITIQFASMYSSELGVGTTECVASVIAEVRQIITLTQEDLSNPFEEETYA